MLLLSQAKRCCQQKDWGLGESLASQAITNGIMVQAAHMVRAKARRFQKKYQEAIDDYAEVLRLDPYNSSALMFRGATYMDWSSHEEDYQQSVHMISNLALRDFTKAGSVNPAQLGIELSILEAQLCLTNYREAIGTAGVCWARASWTRHKIVCAWLGAIALILAGKPERKWQSYAQFLQEPPGGLDGYWCAYSVERLLKHLVTLGFDSSKLDRSRSIHGLFLVQHGPDG